MRWSIGLLFLTLGSLSAAPVDDLLIRLRAVGTEGTGNQEAQAAWKELVKLGEPALLPSLQAMKGASPIAENWLRNAANGIAEKITQSGEKLPVGDLEKFVRDRNQSKTARRLAYELLSDADKTAPGRLLPGMLDDPSNELRRDAIEAAMADAAKSASPKDAYAKLFAASRDVDQAEKLAKTLKDMGTEVNLINHFGLLTKWSLIGPFDGKDGPGFALAHEPEKKIDRSAKYPGKDSKEAVWIDHMTTDAMGVVDLNKAIGKHKFAAAYAYTVVDCDQARDVEIRMTSRVALKLFVNGKEVFAHEEYHHGKRFDQFVAKASLKAGANDILLKICQNNQTEQWAQEWSFQLRICDATGGAIPVTVLQPK